MTYYGDTETWSHSTEFLPTPGWRSLSLPYFHIYLQWTYSYFCSWPYNLLFFILFLPSTLFLGNKVQNSFHSKVLVLQSQPNNEGSSPPPNKYHLWAFWQKDTERFYFPFLRGGIQLKSLKTSSDETKVHTNYNVGKCCALEQKNLALTEIFC